MLNVLLVEPDAQVASRLRRTVRRAVHVESQRRFDAAKRHLAATPVDFLVTNLRLADFNGLHLVYLAATLSQPTRCIVYTEQRDPWLAREVQRTGAFYETLECLPVTLTAYFTHTLPGTDRRDGGRLDRRTLPRGGRRCWDRHAIHSA